jgi:four helix bundle protein
MHTYSFEKLDAWQKGRILNKEIYLLSQKFPVEERFGITSQIRRACISITCNLAEGSGRSTGKEQARFSEIAFGSLMEVLSLLILCADLGYCLASDLALLRPQIDDIALKISRLRSTQLSRV